MERQRALKIDGRLQIDDVISLLAECGFEEIEIPLTESRAF